VGDLLGGIPKVALACLYGLLGPKKKLGPRVTKFCCIFLTAQTNSKRERENERERERERQRQRQRESESQKVRERESSLSLFLHLVIIQSFQLQTKNSFSPAVVLFALD
jgi:hypothetical protein